MPSHLPAAIIHCPHSSVEVPEDLRGRFLLGPAELERELLRMTDRYTDELFALPAEVASCVRFPVSRLVVDPERFEDDAREEMACRGMGVIYTRTSDRGALREPPSEAEREALLDRFYRPHHRRLLEAVDAALAAHGHCLILDGHSFPSRPLPYEKCQDPDRPEICIGTDGCHTPGWLRDAAVRAFEAEGLRVAIDRPFSGALVPLAHYQRTRAVRSLMIEVNRKLYMDAASGERLPEMPRFHASLQRALREIIAEFGRCCGRATGVAGPLA